MRDLRHRRVVMSLGVCLSILRGRDRGTDRLLDAARVSAAEVLAHLDWTLRVAKHCGVAVCDATAGRYRLGSPHPPLAAGVRAHRRAQYRAVPAAPVAA